jgi:hypothetical protein
MERGDGGSMDVCAAYAAIKQEWRCHDVCKTDSLSEPARTSSHGLLARRAMPEPARLVVWQSAAYAASKGHAEKSNCYAS